MSALSGLAQSLYSHFLLRDIAAKVIPGLIAALAISAYAFPGITMRLNDFFTDEDQPFLVILVVLVALYGIGLMFGMLLQFAGWKLWIIEIHIWEGPTLDHAQLVGWRSTLAKIRIYKGPKLDPSMKRSARKTVQFISAAQGKDDLLRKRERLIVLKEMAGNYCVSFIVVILAVLIGSWSEGSVIDVRVKARLALFAVFALLLWRQNKSLAGEQRAFERSTVKKNRPPAFE